MKNSDSPITIKSPNSERHTQKLSSEKKETQQFSPFRKVKIHQLPNSKRTVIPELAVNKFFY